MTVTTATALRLSTAAGLDLGALDVEEVDGRLVLGTFTPGPDYPAVERYFRRLEDLANGQVLSLTDEAMEAIDRLGILIRAAGGPAATPVSDVQIYSDGAASLRLPAGLNGERG